MKKKGFYIGIVILNKKQWSQQANVLLKTPVLGKLDRLCMSEVSSLKYFLLFWTSENTQSSLMNMGVCMRIVIWNKKRGRNKIMCWEKHLYLANWTVFTLIWFLVLNVLFCFVQAYTI